MNPRIIPTNWEKYLPLAIREEGRVVEGGVELLLSKGQGGKEMWNMESPSICTGEMGRK